MTRPAAREFYAAQRGGGLLSEAFSQRIGARLAAGAHRLGLTPSHLSLANLVLGLAGSVVVIALPHHAAAGIVALLCWHLAYAFDCADGQLARVTGQTSAAGARLDILCDLAVQIGLVTAIAATAMRPTWLTAVFAGTWLVNLVTSILATGTHAASLITSTSPIVRAIKLIRDYAAIITLCGLVIALAPSWTPWIVVLFSLSNGGFLLLSVAQSARNGLRHRAAVDLQESLQ